MPVSVLDTTAGSATANAYVSLAVAEQYHLDRPAVGTTWSAATTDQKNAAILWATKLMDNAWFWHGNPTDAVQSLLWPRSGMLKRNKWEYVDIHAIPIELQQATAEFARQLLVSDLAGNSDLETFGVTSFRAGPVAFTFKDSVFAKPVPDTVFLLIPDDWGYPKGRATGVRDLMRA
jgi:hypothetical protein